jgi:hypothetical protein
MPSDRFENYEQGLERLLSQLGTTHPRHRDALVFEVRLRENIADVRLYGDNDTYRTERNKVLHQLNSLALETFQTSFNELSGLPNDAPPASAPAAPTVYQTLRDTLKPTPPPFRPAILRMVEDYEAVFGGRDAELVMLDAFLEQDKQPYT